MKALFFCLFLFSALARAQSNQCPDRTGVPVCELFADQKNGFLNEIYAKGNYLEIGPGMSAMDYLINVVTSKKCAMDVPSVCYIQTVANYSTEYCPNYADYQIKINGVLLYNISDYYTCDYNSAGTRTYGLRNARNIAEQSLRMLKDLTGCR